MTNILNFIHNTAIGYNLLIVLGLLLWLIISQPWWRPQVVRIRKAIVAAILMARIYRLARREMR